MRIPNRRDLYPAGGIRLRLDDGTLLAPVAKTLADPDVTTQPDGALRATLTAPFRLRAGSRRSPSTGVTRCRATASPHAGSNHGRPDCRRRHDRARSDRAARHTADIGRGPVPPCRPRRTELPSRHRDSPAPRSTGSESLVAPPSARSRAGAGAATCSSRRAAPTIRRRPRRWSSCRRCRASSPAPCAGWPAATSSSTCCSLRPTPARSATPTTRSWSTSSSSCSCPRSRPGSGSAPRTASAAIRSRLSKRSTPPRSGRRRDNRHLAGLPHGRRRGWHQAGPAAGADPGAPLTSGQVRVTTGGASHEVTITPASQGDTGIDVAGGAAQIELLDPTGTGVLASSKNDAGSLGSSLALSDGDRHVLVTDTASWFAPRSAGVSGLEAVDRRQHV